MTRDEIIEFLRSKSHHCMVRIAHMQRSQRNNKQQTTDSELKIMSLAKEMFVEAEAETSDLERDTKAVAASLITHFSKTEYTEALKNSAVLGFARDVLTKLDPSLSLWMPETKTSACAPSAPPSPRKP